MKKRAAWFVNTACFWAVIVLILVPPFFYGIKEMIAHYEFFADDDPSIALISNRHRVIHYINTKLPDEGLIYTDRRSDISLYSSRKIVDHLDPRLMGFYQTDDPEIGKSLLWDLNIRYLFISETYSFTVHNSVMESIIGDPRNAELLMDAGGNRLFKLHLSDAAPAYDSIPMRNSKFEQYYQNGMPVQWGSGELMQKGACSVYRDSYTDKSIFQINTQGEVFCNGDSDYWEAAEAIPVRGGGRFSLRTMLSGKGLIRISVIEFNRFGASLDSPKTLLIGRLPAKEKSLAVQFAVSHQTRSFKILYRISGNSQSFARFSEVSLSGDSPAVYDKERESGWVLYRKVALNQFAPDVDAYSFHLAQADCRYLEQYTNLDAAKKVNIWPTEGPYRELTKVDKLKIYAEQLLWKTTEKRIFTLASFPTKKNIYRLRMRISGSGKVGVSILALLDDDRDRITITRIGVIDCPAGAKVFQQEFQLPPNVSHIEPMLTMEKYAPADTLCVSDMVIEKLAGTAERAGED